MQLLKVFHLTMIPPLMLQVRVGRSPRCGLDSVTTAEGRNDLDLSPILLALSACKLPTPHDLALN